MAQSGASNAWERCVTSGNGWPLAQTCARVGVVATLWTTQLQAATCALLWFQLGHVMPMHPERK